jgi:hypothetical protein
MISRFVSDDCVVEKVEVSASLRVFGYWRVEKPPLAAITALQRHGAVMFDPIG